MMTICYLIDYQSPHPSAHSRHWTKVICKWAGKRGLIKNRVTIDDRPKIVEEKSRIGDWEGDTVIGKNHKGGLVTLAERKSRYVLLGHTAASMPTA